MTLGEELERVKAPSRKAAERAKARWDHVAKPLHGLGLLEDMVVKIAAVQGTDQIRLEHRTLLIFCADNGVVEEGVTQTGQNVTAVVTRNFTKGDASVCRMARMAGARVVPVDIGVADALADCGQVWPLERRKIAWGTRNLRREPAMTRQEAEAAVETGVRLAVEQKKAGCDLLALGEMGIGNTTTAAAVASVLLGADPEEMTGPGAGLSREGVARKVQVIRDAIALRRPDRADAMDVLAKVGGLDLAGLAGACLGGAICGMPVVLDGVITLAAALAAARLCPAAREVLLASHVPGEPAGRRILEELGLEAPIAAGLHLGEGTGAMAVLPMLAMAADIYLHMSTFQDIQIEEYRPL